MYPPESSTDPEMFYQRSTDREMAARRKRRTRVCRPMCVCVVADTGRALYEAPGVWPLQTPRIHAARSPECRAQSERRQAPAAPRPEEDMSALWRTSEPTGDLWPQ